MNDDIVRDTGQTKNITERRMEKIMINTDDVRKKTDAILKALSESEEPEYRRRIAAILETIEDGES